MKMEYCTDVKEGVFTLKEYKKGLEVVSYAGEEIYLTIPENFEKPVVSLGKKALLSCKQVRRVSLPETIEEVGDWAFAYCDELREIRIPAKNIRFGKGIFRECGKLRFVTVEGKPKEAGALLAAAVTLLDAPYLFTPQRCGDDDWLKQWDARMLQMLRAADREGYSKMVLCGEEDYGSRENNLDYYLNQKRRTKVRVAFMRLLNWMGLQGEVREELEDYLRAHTEGSGYAGGMSAGKDGADIWDETWQVLLEEHGEDSEYYKLFTEIGCLTEDNFDRILSQTGESCPEMKAWFLKYKEENIGYKDFFEDLML
ncbi:MAG: leucine-rich repeat domain-containing protein [Lachnospiraceae bacterium]|nr:leucine-rich repeat domain-containing protein [Lachnospiraceae bacterium]